MNISTPKLKAILRYFGSNTEPRLLGKVKLMKLFYFLDFLHVKKFGAPITYDTYVHLEHGPIPSAIKNLVDTADDDIDNSILSDIIEIERQCDNDMHRVVLKKKFSENDKKYFSNSELEILSVVCNRFGDKNARYIKEASHNEAPWRETNLLDIIPYHLAVKDKDCEVELEEIETLLSVYGLC